MTRSKGFEKIVFVSFVIKLLSLSEIEMMITHFCLACAYASKVITLGMSALHRVSQHLCLQFLKINRLHISHMSA